MTNTTKAGEQGLKTDLLGRAKTPAARREQLLNEFERSGLQGQKFAEVVGIKYLRAVLTRLPHMTNRQTPMSCPKLGIKGNCRCNGSHHQRRSIIFLTLTALAVALSIGAWRDAYDILH